MSWHQGQGQHSQENALPTSILQISWNQSWTWDGGGDGDGDGDDEDDAAVQYQLDLHDLASNLSMQWQKDDWVAVKYSNDWYPGVIIEVISIL